MLTKPIARKNWTMRRCVPHSGFLLGGLAARLARRGGRRLYAPGRRPRFDVLAAPVRLRKKNSRSASLSCDPSDRSAMDRGSRSSGHIHMNLRYDLCPNTTFAHRHRVARRR